jgi:hypothetical protein
VALVYYTISTAPFASGAWLLLHDADRRAELDESLAAFSGLGRIAVPPEELEVRGALEGEQEHYSDGEIAASTNGVPLPYERESRTLLVVEPFVEALERVGAAFRARPITLVHRATGRTWPFWLITYTLARYLPHLRDDRDPVFFDRESVTIAYYSAALRDALATLGWSWMDFRKHELAACAALPIGDGPDADKTLVAAVGALFITKKPRVEIGRSYAASYFVDRLLTKYSDATHERVRLAFEREPESSVFFPLKAGVLDGMGVRPDSPLAKRLSR